MNRVIKRQFYKRSSSKIPIPRQIYLGATTYDKFIWEAQHDYVINPVLTHLPYEAMLKNVKCQIIIHNFECARKARLADIICYCKMTSFMALDGVTSFLSTKDVINTCKCMQHSPAIGGSSSVQWRKVGRS